MNSTTATKAQRTPSVVTFPATKDGGSVTPFKAEEDYSICAGGLKVAQVGGDYYSTKDRMFADAVFIVTACNAYDAHVARIAELETAMREIALVARTSIYNSRATKASILDGLKVIAARAALAKGQV